MPGLKFRILLDSHKNEEVFHDILVSDDENFESLFKSIIEAFEFRGDQMASFYVSNENWDKGEEISLLDLSEGEESSNLKIMKNTRINECLFDTDQKFILIYDFMKMWTFFVELIEEGKLINNLKYPRIIFSNGMVPNVAPKKIFDKKDLESDYEDDFLF